MIKYVDYDIVFQEVPGEVTLALNISNCQHNCEGCHSPHLRENIGEDLLKSLPGLLEKYKGMITCVLILGEGNDFLALCECIDMIKAAGLKSAVYSGLVDYPADLEEKRIVHAAYDVGLPDYVKLGGYKKELGGLASPSTNQRMYRWNREIGAYDDITYMFWRKPE